MKKLLTDVLLLIATVSWIFITLWTLTLIDFRNTKHYKIQQEARKENWQEEIRSNTKKFCKRSGNWAVVPVELLLKCHCFFSDLSYFKILFDFENLLKSGFSPITLQVEKIGSKLLDLSSLLSGFPRNSITLPDFFKEICSNFFQLLIIINHMRWICLQLS